MNQKIEQWKNLRVLYYDVYITGKDADYMFKKVQDVIKSGNPALFTSSDRQMLSQGVFTQDLSQLSLGMLNFTNLRDNARELMGSAVDVSRNVLILDCRHGVLLVRPCPMMNHRKELMAQATMLLLSENLRMQL